MCAKQPIHRLCSVQNSEMKKASFSVLIRFPVGEFLTFPFENCKRNSELHHVEEENWGRGDLSQKASLFFEPLVLRENHDSRLPNLNDEPTVLFALEKYWKGRNAAISLFVIHCLTC